MFKRFLRPNLAPRITEKLVIDFRQPALGRANLLTRSDEDLGGFSTVSLDVHDAGGPRPYARFAGDISLDLPEDRPEVIRLGYAMFRTKDVQPPLLGLGGSEFLDWSTFNQLALRVRGDHRKYFINIQADTPYPTDLYQHRLFLKTPGEWETVSVSFANFILTNGGVIQHQQRLDTEHVRSVGIGLVDGQYGPYSLDVAWVKVKSGEPEPDAELSAGVQAPHPPAAAAAAAAIPVAESPMGPVEDPDLEQEREVEHAPVAGAATPGKRLSVDD